MSYWSPPPPPQSRQIKYFRFSYKTQVGKSYPPSKGKREVHTEISQPLTRFTVGVPTAVADLCGSLRAGHLLQAAVQVLLPQPQK